MKFQAMEQNGVWGIKGPTGFRAMCDEQDAKSFAADLNEAAQERADAYAAAKAKRWAEKKVVRRCRSLTPIRLDQYNGPMFLRMAEPRKISTTEGKVREVDKIVSLFGISVGG